jgi:polyphosphate kinase
MIKNHKGFLFKDREISWLAFNERVLQEASDPDVPIIERLKFLAIFSSNLDEFFRVRVATIRRLMKLKKKPFGKRNFLPSEIIAEIQNIVLFQQQKFGTIYQQLIGTEFPARDIHFINEKQLTPEQSIHVKAYFNQEVLPYLFPIMLDSVGTFPHLVDRSIYMAIEMKNSREAFSHRYALLEIPSSVVKRFYIVPESADGKTYIILLDDIIRNSLDEMFSIFNYDLFEAYTIKLTRDAELETDNDISENLLEKFEKSLKQRKTGSPVRFIYDTHISRELLHFLISRLNLSKHSLIPGARYHNFKDFMDFPKIGPPDLKYPPMQLTPIRDFEEAKILFDVIKQKDYVLHHPYHSFNYVIRLLREAAIDPHVEAIKITLYRVARHSNVVNALINAVKNGKTVTVFMELRARFDEESNIYWSNQLIEAGAKVYFGKPGFKIHCKMCLIYRRENNKVVHYGHLSTGNYNRNTASLYCDHGLLTSDKRLTKDMIKAFYYISKTIDTPVIYDHLLVAPHYMQSAFIKLINNEIENARKGKPAYMILKMNSLVDEEMIVKLYEASQAGVKIRMIIRGICRLVAGVKNLSENIEVVSIIDRLLEHARVYVFANGGKEKYYLASADWMTRNLQSRVEVAFPIYDEKIQEQIKTILEIQLADNTKARWLNLEQNNSYKRTSGQNVRSQYAIADYVKNLAVQ